MLRVVAISSFLLSVSAFACDSGKAYVRADAGFDILAKNPHKADYSKKPKGSPVYGVGFGYKFNNNLRSDITITHRSNFKYSGHDLANDKAKQDIKSTAFMLNAYYDILNYGGFTPYVMAGAGMAYNKAGDFSVGSIKKLGAEKSSAAFQAGLGTQYKVSKNVDLDVGYKYVSLGTISTSRVLEDHVVAPTKGKLRAHEITCGISYNF